MQINGIARQLLGPLQFDSAPSPPAGNAPAVGGAEPAGNDLVTDRGSAFHEILSRYDVTQITPREFSNLVQELHAAGEIDDAEFRELARMRLELEQGEYGPDDQLSLVDFFEDKLRRQADEFESARAQATPQVAATLDEAPYTAEAKRQLEWIRKFAIVQASGADAVDVGA
jgi:hypothetical protein